MVEVEEELSVEIVEAGASTEKTEGDQAEGRGSEPVLVAAEKMLGDQSERIVEETVLTVVEARTGAEPVLEIMEDISGEESDLMEVD